MLLGHNSVLLPNVEESSIHAGVTGRHSVISEAAASTDVPTFDLSIILSSSDEEIEFNPDDSTADMSM